MIEFGGTGLEPEFGFGSEPYPGLGYLVCFMNLEKKFSSLVGSRDLTTEV